jgi:hypothetical protein
MIALSQSLHEVSRQLFVWLQLMPKLALAMRWRQNLTLRLRWISLDMHSTPKTILMAKCKSKTSKNRRLKCRITATQMASHQGNANALTKHRVLVTDGINIVCRLRVVFAVLQTVYGNDYVGNTVGM